MKKLSLLFLATIFILNCYAQQRKSSKRPNQYYTNTLNYQKNYIKNHELVLAKDKKYFNFFKPNARFKLSATFIKSIDTTTVTIKTSGKKIPEKYFTHYGTLVFIIDSVEYQLTVFQSNDLIGNVKYKDYLFLPFSDKTNGNSTYGTGRYIDLLTTDIKEEKCTIDFNKAYNPYCAYSNDYNCPIPPKENRLPIAITAGEMSFAKPIAH